MELKQLFSKANNEHKPIIGSDFDGVVTSGLVPSKGTIILTGRKKEHKEEMQKLLPNGNKIYFFPDHDKITDSNKDEIVGNWKADMVAELGLEKFYEDTKKQTKIIQEKNPYTEVVHVSHETTEDNEKELKFVIISTFGELLDVAIQLEKVEGYETKFCVPNSSYEKIGDGIVTKEKDWHRCLGKNYVWVVDGCETADLQEWLREQGSM